MDKDLKTLNVEGKIIKEKGICKVILTKEIVDRDGEIISVDGLDLAKYEANPIVLKHVGNSLDLKLEHFDDSLLHYISYVIEETKKEQEVLVKYLTLTDFLILSIDKFVNGKKINIVKNTLTEID